MGGSGVYIVVELFTNEAIGRRLVALRRLLGYNQTAFAAFIGVTQPGMNSYERGARRPSIGVARTIVLKTGVTLDWIYLGNRGALPAHLLAQLPLEDECDRQTARNHH